MSLAEILGGSTAVLVIALSLIQISPIKVNPWSWLARCIGRAINGDVLDKLSDLQARHTQLQDELGQHIADGDRARILDFCTELIRDLEHTQEDYNEILATIDRYEKYCKGHPEYPNNRATHAVSHIKRCYDERLTKHDFS